MLLLYSISENKNSFLLDWIVKHIAHIHTQLQFLLPSLLLNDLHLLILSMLHLSVIVLTYLLSVEILLHGQIYLEGKSEITGQNSSAER